MIFDPRITNRDYIKTISENKMGLCSGITVLDDKILGFGLGDYVIIGGRPGMGKSSIGRNIALNVSKTNMVLFFSMEMQCDLLADIFAANLAKVNFFKVSRGSITNVDKKALETASKQFKKRQLKIIYDSYMTPTTIRRDIEKFGKEEKIDCVIIDYIQLLTNDVRTRRQEELSEISRQILAIANDFNIPVIVMSQLNRQVTYRESSRPQLSDLRESGTLEQDAKKVLLLHRPSYYDIKLDCDAEDDGEVEIIIAKNRCGPVGSVQCAFISDWMSFCDLPGDF